MREYWNSVFGLDEKRSIWVEQDELGKNRLIEHKNKRYNVKIPRKINKEVTLRLRGLGKTRGDKTGDLLLHIWLNKGDDIRKSLWLSETSARNGANKILSFEGRKIRVLIPKNSHQGLVIRLRGLGRKPGFRWRTPFFPRIGGDLLVTLSVYPDSITPAYAPFETLATDDMVLEGWVYRKLDEIVSKVGKSSFPVNPMRADAVADPFNELGWRGVFHALVDYLQLTHVDIQITPSDSIALPGSCQKTIALQNGVPVACKYTITIREQFLDNPFSIAAIIAHELCHVIYSETIEGQSKWVAYSLKTEQDTLEEERTVDLLVFMLKIGEFQLRLSRDKRLTLGYFNQGIFERIQVIVSRKLNWN
jgi:hypothetical protein